MSAAIPSVDEVYGALIERISAGVIPVGGKLPSCRALADELGSNPSTVNRALRRLSRHGLIRTEPRVGSFLVNAGTARQVGHDEVAGEVRRAIVAARSAGLDGVQIRAIVESSLAAGTRAGGGVAFVECNEGDLIRMAQLVENATGVALQPMLIEDLQPGWEDSIDVVTTPMFHLAGVVAVTADMDRVVELHFVPSARVLRQLATIDPTARVGVIAPTARGVERMRALISQYYEGPILTPSLEVPASFEAIDVLVHPSALEPPPEVADRIEVRVVIEWELDPASAAGFAGRVAMATPSPSAR